MIRLKELSRILPLVAIAAASIGIIHAGPPEGKGKPAPAYDVFDLQGFPETDGFSLSEAFGLTEADGAGNIIVVGTSRLAATNDWNPVVWGVGGDDSVLLTDLGAPAVGDLVASATDINNLGVITINTIASANPDDPAWVLFPGQSLQQLPSNGLPESTPFAINDFNQIVGTGGGGKLWEFDDLGTLQNTISFADFSPEAISDTGVMAGRVGTVPAIAWFDESNQLVVTPLGLLPGAINGSATAISSDGTWVAGTANRLDPDGFGFIPEAFAWNSVDGLLALGGLNKRNVSSEATGVNSDGQVVGRSFTGTRNSPAAFLWDDDDMQMVNLNKVVDLGSKVHLRWANGINEHGAIIGLLIDTRSDGGEHAFLLRPTP